MQAIRFLFVCSRLFALGDSESEREPQPSEVCRSCENRGWGDIQVMTEGYDAAVPRAFVYLRTRLSN